uniref:Uncharacterized protein n=1 Tax=Glossina austeni TaxID=7395 RepID=A0A1A9ULB9_GLOAU
MKPTEKNRTNLQESISSYSQVGSESNINTQLSPMGITGHISLGSILLLRSTPEYYSPDAYRRQQHHFCTRLHKERLWFSCYILFYIGYLLIVAVSMHIIESPIKNAKRQDFVELRAKFLEMYPQVLGLIGC